MEIRYDIEKRISDIIRMLPPRDESIDELLRLASEKHPDRDKLIKLIEDDSSLCANLFFLANSHCYGRASNGPAIETVEEALEHVGPDDLAALVGTSYARGLMSEKLWHTELWEDYTEHARSISHCCSVMAEILDMPPHMQQMYTVAGLIHDIGRLVILITAEGKNCSLLGTRPEAMAQIIEDEREAFGLDHCEIGRDLLRKWRLPKALEEGVLRHHSPLIEDDFDFCGALIFVSHLVSMSDFTGDIISRMLPPELLEKLGLSAKDLDAACRRYAELNP